MRSTAETDICICSRLPFSPLFFSTAEPLSKRHCSNSKRPVVVCPAYPKKLIDGETSDSVVHQPNLSLPDFPLNYPQSSQKPERLLYTAIVSTITGSHKHWKDVVATELLILPLVNQIFAYQEIIRDDLNF
jgi:hypothetical protein